MAILGFYARHHRLDLRQVDVVIGMHVRLIAGSWRLSAAGASIGKHFAHIVRGLGELASNSRPFFAWLLLFPRPVRFLALRRR